MADHGIDPRRCGKLLDEQLAATKENSKRRYWHDGVSSPSTRGEGVALFQNNPLGGQGTNRIRVPRWPVELMMSR